MTTTNRTVALAAGMVLAAAMHGSTWRPASPRAR